MKGRRVPPAATREQNSNHPVLIGYIPNATAKSGLTTVMYNPKTNNVTWHQFEIERLQKEVLAAGGTLANPEGEVRP